MSRAVGVDVEQLRAGAKELKRAAMGGRPSADDSHGFGSPVAFRAVSRFEAYWVPGQAAVDELTVGLSDALEQVASSYERRDAEDARGFQSDRGGSHGF